MVKVKKLKPWIIATPETSVTPGICQSPNINYPFCYKDPDPVYQIFPPLKINTGLLTHHRVYLMSWPGTIKSIIFCGEFGSQEKERGRCQITHVQFLLLWRPGKCSAYIFGSREHNCLTAPISALSGANSAIALNHLGLLPHRDWARLRDWCHSFLRLL